MQIPQLVNAQRTRILASTGIAIFFLLFMAIDLLLSVTGIVWTVLPAEAFLFWGVFVTACTMAVGGGILTNSLLYYGQLRNVRRLVILFLAANTLMLAVLYLLTHPSSVLLSSPFADRLRNRTITATFGLASMPAALLSSFAGDAPATVRNRVLYGLWGGVIIPIFGLLCFFSPEPLFVLTAPEGGLGGLTMAGWLVAVINPLFAAIAFIKFVMEYRKSRDRVVLAFALALLLWATASIFLSVLWDPNQVAELVYMTNALGGLALLGIAMVIDAIVEPFKTLETEIHKRTEELQESKTETELFLSAWTHKVGNLLQGITTYMDLIDRARSSGEGIADYQKEAAELNWQVRTINRQVTWLSQVKSSSGLPLAPVSLNQAVSKAVGSIAELAKGRSILFTPSDDGVKVWADDNLDLLFTGLFSHCLLGPGRSAACVSAKCMTEEGRIAVELEVERGSSVDNMREFLQSKDLPEVVTLDLDIYMTRLLLHRYGASVGTRGKKDNILLLGFRRANE